MSITVINATPHAINLADDAGNIVAGFAPSGVVARCVTTSEVVGELAGCCSPGFSEGISLLKVWLRAYKCSLISCRGRT